MPNAKDDIAEYLRTIPSDRLSSFSSIRKVILDNLPEGYEEVLNWGMITYQVPLATKPDTYNKKPLMYAALANQKNYMSLYLCMVYADDDVRDTFIEESMSIGKKLDMGKSCIRFRKSEDLPLQLVAKTISSTSVEETIKMHDAIHGK